MPFKFKIEKDADIQALNLAQVNEAISERQDVLRQVFAEAGEALDPANVKVIDVRDGADLAAQINARNDELTRLGERKAALEKLSNIKRALDQAPVNPDESKWAPVNRNTEAWQPAKSMGQLLVESPVYNAARQKQPGVTAILDGRPEDLVGLRPVNANFTTSAGWAPESLRTGRVVLSAQRPIEVTDLLPVFPTTMAAIVYMEETTFTSAAAERAEAAAYAESTLALTQRSVTVRSIGTSIPVTDEQLADVDGVAAYLDQRLGFMVRQRLDSQILVGDGIAPNLTGTLNVAGIQTQARGTDPNVEAIFKAMILVRATGRATPGVVILHPNNWQTIRLLRTADGIYIWGNPGSSDPDMLWGVPVVVTTAVTANTGIVGDYANFAGLHIRQGLEVQTGYVNDDFTKGLIHIRAGLRAAVVHYRPAAFCSVTGLN